jgi:hypothetical protein
MLPKAKLIVVLLALLLMLLLPATTMVGSAAAPRTVERLTVQFVNGVQGVQTVNRFSGQILIKVTGIGQASGSQWSDAFYVFTDYDGKPMEPWHPEEFYNFTLWINGGPVDVVLGEIPPYNPRHVYVFTINALEGPLTFAVGDTYTIDNTGEYQVLVRTLPRLTSD